MIGRLEFIRWIVLCTFYIPLIIVIYVDSNVQFHLEDQTSENENKSIMRLNNNHAIINPELTNDLTNL